MTAQIDWSGHTVNKRQKQSAPDNKTKSQRHKNIAAMLSKRNIMKFIEIELDNCVWEYVYFLLNNRDRYVWVYMYIYYNVIYTNSSVCVLGNHYRIKYCFCGNRPIEFDAASNDFAIPFVWGETTTLRPKGISVRMNIDGWLHFRCAFCYCYSASNLLAVPLKLSTIVIISNEIRTFREESYSLLTYICMYVYPYMVSTYLRVTYFGINILVSK